MYGAKLEKNFEKCTQNMQHFRSPNSCTLILQDYIIRRLQLESDQILEDERLIKQYREDTEKKREQIEEMKTTYVTKMVSKMARMEDST